MAFPDRIVCTTKNRRTVEAGESAPFFNGHAALPVGVGEGKTSGGPFQKGLTLSAVQIINCPNDKEMCNNRKCNWAKKGTAAAAADPKMRQILLSPLSKAVQKRLYRVSQWPSHPRAQIWGQRLIWRRSEEDETGSRLLHIYKFC